MAPAGNVPTPEAFFGEALIGLLSIALGREVTSDRIKSVAHPNPTVWMHHLELWDPGQVDGEVRELLCEAHQRAG